MATENKLTLGANCGQADIFHPTASGQGKRFLLTEARQAE
jgi:hypothetical protein